MSATGGEDPTPKEPESPVSPMAERSEATGVVEGLGPDASAAQASCEAQVSSEIQVLGAGAAEEGMGPEVAQPEHGAGAALSSSSSSSSIGPAEELERGADRGPNRLVNPRQFPLINFRVTFVELVSSLLRRVHHNDHLLIRPYENVQVLRRRPPHAATASRQRPRHGRSSGPLPVPQAPLCSSAGVPLQGEGEGRAAAAILAAAVEEQAACGGGAAGKLAEAQEAIKETAQSGEQKDEDDMDDEQAEAATQTLCENPSDAQGLGGEEQKEAEEESKKDNENQQEWEKDTDLAGGSLEKPSSED
ncbi:cancer/testis antigen family 47 member C1 isoform X1 [Cavia porcellus]|uniref:cancer/testis antigen family 47 member C1 isoform X1 n=1 Tax=Cavia porcellus TaxID=10141 RepID=UPI002FE24B52